MCNIHTIKRETTKYSHMLVSVFFLLLMSCDLSDLLFYKVSSDEKAPETDIHIAEFSFRLEENPFLPHPYKAHIDKDVITLSIPSYYIDTYGDSLVPTIKGSFSRIYPHSGISRQFSSERDNMSYTISNARGKIKQYQVSIVPILHSESQIVSFVLEKEKNALLPYDIEGIIEQSSKRIVLILNGEIIKDTLFFIPTIHTSENGTLSPHSGIIQDFSSPVSYTVSSEDSNSLSLYTVVVSADINSLIDIESISMGAFKRSQYGNQVNIQGRQHYAEFVDEIQKEIIYLPPVEYLFLKDKYIKLDFNFNTDARLESDEFVVLPHTYTVKARDGTTTVEVEVALSPVPTPMYVKYHDLHTPDYYSYDFTKNTAWFPTSSQLSSQPDAVHVFYLSESIEDIEVQRDLFPYADVSDEGLFKIVSYRRAGIEMPDNWDDLGIITTRNGNKQYTLHIDSKGDDENIISISHDFFEGINRDNVLVSLYLSPFLVGVFDLSRNFHMSLLREVHVPKVEMTIYDYFDIKAPVEVVDYDVKYGTVTREYTDIPPFEQRCSHNIHLLHTSWQQHFSTHTEREESAFALNYDDTRYVNLPILYNGTLFSYIRDFNNIIIYAGKIVSEQLSGYYRRDTNSSPDEFHCGVLRTYSVKRGVVPLQFLKNTYDMSYSYLNKRHFNFITRVDRTKNIFLDE